MRAIFMQAVAVCELPSNALLIRHREQGSYTDCYCCEVNMAVSFEAYVTAFYTTLPFRAERLILTLALRLPSSDQQANALARGELDRFAAWTVEDRADGQLLLNAVDGNTCSWLMTDVVSADPPRTRLYFGSAVLRRRDPVDGTARLATGYRLLLGFHKLYSHILLRAARRRVLRDQ